MRSAALILLKFLKQRSIQVLLALGLYVICAEFLPLFAHQFFYAISLYPIKMKIGC